jgi:hypothetical protein
MNRAEWLPYIHLAILISVGESVLSSTEGNKFRHLNELQDDITNRYSVRLPDNFVGEFLSSCAPHFLEREDDLVAGRYFGPRPVSQAYSVFETVYSSDPEIQRLYSRFNKLGHTWLAAAIRKIAEDTSFDFDDGTNDDRPEIAPKVESDSWEPLPIDRKSPQFSEALESIDKLIAEVRENNGLAVEFADKKDGLLSTLKAGYEALKTGIITSTTVEVLILKPTRWIMTNITVGVLQEAGKHVLDSIRALIGI